MTSCRWPFDRARSVLLHFSIYLCTIRVDLERYVSLGLLGLLCKHLWAFLVTPYLHIHQCKHSEGYEIIIQLSATDLLALASMKNAAKCDK